MYKSSTTQYEKIWHRLTSHAADGGSSLHISYNTGIALQIIHSWVNGRGTYRVVVISFSGHAFQSDVCILAFRFQIPAHQQVIHVPQQHGIVKNCAVVSKLWRHVDIGTEALQGYLETVDTHSSRQTALIQLTFAARLTSSVTWIDLQSPWSTRCLRCA